MTSSESVPADCWQLAAQMRELDAFEMRALGLEPAKAIQMAYADAIMRTTYFVDGEIAAMVGLGGTLLSDIGFPYLLTANGIEAAPFAVLREAKKNVVQMLAVKRVLEGEVLSSYSGAVRLLRAIGFKIEKPRPFGVNGEMFSRFFMER